MLKPALLPCQYQKSPLLFFNTIFISARLFFAPVLHQSLICLDYGKHSGFSRITEVIMDMIFPLLMAALFIVSWLFVELAEKV
jgi:hypothetical protein